MFSFLRTTIICFGLLFFSFSEGFSAVSFVPASDIYMSGTTTDLRFDVTSAIVDSGSTVLPPHLHTDTKSFSGAFYLSGAGWVQFDTGSYVVSLDCGSQSLDSLTNNCKLYGSGYSETIGEVGFSGSEYIPTQGVLSGSMTSLFGNFSLDNVYLPLLPALFTDMSSSGEVLHNRAFSIASPGRYNTTANLWNISFTPSGTSYPQNYVSTIFSADLSLASIYDTEITDPNGSKTRFSYEAYSATPSKTLLAGTYFIQNFCDNISPVADTRCPDGKILKATSLMNSSNTVVADGQATIDFMFKLRDTYGNPVNHGNLTLSYSTDTRTLPVEAPIAYGAPDFLGVLKHSGPYALTSGLFDGVATYSGIISTDTLNFSIAARLPVDSLKLTSLIYNGSPANGITSDVSFIPFFNVSSIVPQTSDVRIGSDVAFDVTMSANSARNDIFPDVIHAMNIGDNVFATFSNYQKPGTILCEANQTDLSTYKDECNWTSVNGKTLPSILIAPGSASYSFTGNYSPINALAYAPPETLSYSTYISYVMDGYTLLYPSKSEGIAGVTSSFQDRRIRILGQSQNASEWYSGISKGNTSRSSFFNKIHKSAGLLSRNRSSYTDVNYSIYSGSINISDASFNNKRSIIVIGGDITITGSTINKRNHPLSIIALSRDGIGGNIYIDQGVTDISSSLIAEKSVFSSGANQLYIEGSFISSNTIGQSDSGVCPYYITACTNPDIYDIEKFRKDYLALPPGDKPAHHASMSTPLRFPDTAIIVEYDSRILNDAPPALGEEKL